MQRDSPAGNFSVSIAGSNLLLHYQAVPEPGTLTLLATASFGFLRLVRRQRQLRHGSLGQSGL
jgi:hypothetical protein